MTPIIFLLAIKVDPKKYMEFKIIMHFKSIILLHFEINHEFLSLNILNLSFSPRSLCILNLVIFLLIFTFISFKNARSLIKSFNL